MLTWIGDYSGSGAYPTINRHMTKALEKLGVPILRNQHNAGLDLTPLALTCTYPPSLPNVRHDRNVCLTTWEFKGGQGVPRSFVEVFDRLDLVLAMSAWVADQFREVTRTPVEVVPLGFDPDEFTPDGAVIDWNVVFRDQAWANDPATKFVLWVGGTDKRHGLDIAYEVIKRLPANYHLIAKTSVDYPPAAIEAHPQIHVIRQDLGSLAPLDRACDVFLHTARGVGFSLPCLEAMACGAQVVSTNCPPVFEFDINTIILESGHWEYFNHHIHKDCLPQWFEPYIPDLVKQILEIHVIRKASQQRFEAWRTDHTWEASAKKLIEVLDIARA